MSTLYLESLFTPFNENGYDLQFDPSLVRLKKVKCKQPGRNEQKLKYFLRNQDISEEV